MADRTYFDFIVIGAGIVGLTIARRLRELDSNSKILVIDKESGVAEHASGRNSGVLHAGFYYSADSLKARFSILGNQRMREYCKENELALEEPGKLVVATNEAELEKLYELERRGNQNGSQVKIISAVEAKRLEPFVKTLDSALWSPLTASVNPVEVCNCLRDELRSDGVEFAFGNPVVAVSIGEVRTEAGAIYHCGQFINCAGLYADKLARQLGFGEKYTILPFKGLYLKYTKGLSPLTRHIYPVPNLKNPFLGTHFTKTVDGVLKIGPTATPAFWREHYDWRSNFRLDEAFSILGTEAKLLVTNAFGFRNLAVEEIKKYRKRYLIAQAMKLVEGLDASGFTEFSRPGIRAQLLNKETSELVTDFVVEGDEHSVHVLNAISPGFTCSFPFADWVVENFLKKGSLTD
jgi:L-2-hydroxyglutarate oxidase LhgO